LRGRTKTWKDGNGKIAHQGNKPLLLLISSSTSSSSFFFFDSLGAHGWLAFFSAFGHYVAWPALAQERIGRQHLDLSKEKKEDEGRTRKRRGSKHR